LDNTILWALSLISTLRPLKTGELRIMEYTNEVTMFFLLIGISFFSDEALRMSSVEFFEIRDMAGRVVLGIIIGHLGLYMLYLGFFLVKSLINSIKLRRYMNKYMK
jgi:hypothetical protein